MFWNHFASTTSESAPCGVVPAPIFHGNSEAGVGPAHSGIYTSKTAIAQICKWLKERQKNSSPA